MSKWAWNKVQKAYDNIVDNYNLAYEMDSGFDAGEFSGPALDRSREKEIDNMLERSGWNYDDFSRQMMMEYDSDDFLHERF